MYVAIYGIIILVIVACIIPMSTGFLAALGLIAAVLMIIVLAKRNFDLKQSMNKYPDDMRIIQNVKEGGVIKFANIDGYNEDLELKVIGRNLYMEGDYSWYELECVKGDGEKVWVDVDDDDELMVSVVLKKITMQDINANASLLEHIDDEETGAVYYESVRYNYIDSGDAKFYKHCDDSKVENLYYWDFKSASGKYLVSVEKWKNEDGKPDYVCYYSQIVKPMAITVYSTHGEEQK